MYFFVDEKRGIQMKYDDLVKKLNELEEIPRYIYTDSPVDVLTLLIASMTLGEEVVLLDSDFSLQELNNIGITQNDLNENPIIFKHNQFENMDEVLNTIENNRSWRLKLFTSGTTGRPKEVSHSIKSITRNVKKGNKFSENVWGFAYNPTHFAGLQVFIQAIFNLNTMVYVFETKDRSIEEIFKKYKISHISATPTYFRTILPYFKNDISTVISVTQGGEKFDSVLVDIIKKVFPSARIRNIYASTEAGSLFNSASDVFKIRSEIADYIKISDDNELWIHKDLLGQSESFTLDGDWYSTGDVVELIGENEFRFQSRKTEMINVGGYKVNPHEIEAMMSQLLYIQNALVYGKANSVVGNMLIAEIELSSNVEVDLDNIVKDIKKYLSNNLQKWKVPRQIKIVEKIQLTRSGKKVRR